MGVSKYDNAFKQKVLVKEIDKKVANVRRNTYKQVVKKVIADDNGEIVSQLFTSAFNEMYEPYRKGYNEIDCAVRLNESKYRKAKKVREKIVDIVLNDKAVFITLTFTDKVLAETSAETRRRYVARYLKQFANKYVANIDFGVDKRYTEREHYHAVCDSTIDFTKWAYGRINAERIHNHDYNLQAVSKYITKLTNHALKVEGVQPRLIYSRNTQYNIITPTELRQLSQEQHPHRQQKGAFFMLFERLI